jgi:hypothetical protein
MDLLIIFIYERIDYTPRQKIKGQKQKAKIEGREGK